MNKLKITKNNIRWLIARAWFYTKLGWGAYIAPIFAPIAYITILYGLVLENYLPNSIWVYIFIFGLVMGFSMFLGIEMKRHDFYGEEHAINTESNPYIDKLIGKKELLSWRMSYINLQKDIKMTKLMLNFIDKKEVNKEQIQEVIALTNEEASLVKEYQEMLGLHR